MEAAATVAATAADAGTGTLAIDNHAAAMDMDAAAGLVEIAADASHISVFGHIGVADIELSNKSAFTLGPDVEGRAVWHTDALFGAEDGAVHEDKVYLARHGDAVVEGDGILIHRVPSRTQHHLGFIGNLAHLVVADHLTHHAVVVEVGDGRHGAVNRMTAIKLTAALRKNVVGGIEVVGEIADNVAIGELGVVLGEA